MYPPLHDPAITATQIPPATDQSARYARSADRSHRPTATPPLGRSAGRRFEERATSRYISRRDTPRAHSKLHRNSQCPQRMPGREPVVEHPQGISRHEIFHAARRHPTAVVLARATAHGDRAAHRAHPGTTARPQARRNSRFFIDSAHPTGCDLGMHRPNLDVSYRFDDKTREGPAMRKRRRRKKPEARVD